MGKDTRYEDISDGPVPPKEADDELDMLDMLTPLDQACGKADGSGIVVRSTEPVGFSASGKIINLVQIENLTDALRHVTLATQTCGVYPLERTAELRDALSGSGFQRVVRLGNHLRGSFGGLPHQGGWPLHRIMHWVACDADG